MPQLEAESFYCIQNCISKAQRKLGHVQHFLDFTIQTHAKVQQDLSVSLHVAFVTPSFQA